MTRHGGKGGSGVGRLGRAILALSVAADRRAEVVADLEEGLVRRAASWGPLALRWWYLRQLGGFLVWGLADRLEEWRTRDRPPARGASDGVLASLAHDLRSAARTLRRAPVFTGMAVFTLALGIGGNTAVFSVVDRVLLEPLPYAEPDRLVAIHETFHGRSYWSSAPGSIVAWRERSRTLDGIAWSEVGRRTLTGTGEPVRVGVAAVSANFLDVLGTPPERGRGFLPGEDAEGAAPVAVVSHDLWRTWLGGGPDAVGSHVTLDGVPHTVVGILEPGGAADFVGTHQILVPHRLTEAEIRSRGRVLQAIGRLAEGVDLPAAQDEMDAVASELDRIEGRMKGWGVRLRPLREEIVGDVRPTLLVLLGGVGFVLLVACVNVGSLFLARTSARAGELALRTALGASRGRLARMLSLEAGLVALAGEPHRSRPDAEGRVRGGPREGTPPILFARRAVRIDLRETLRAE